MEVGREVIFRGFKFSGGWGRLRVVENIGEFFGD